MNCNCCKSRLGLRCNCKLIISAIFYRIWLFRKRHLLITFLQILMPSLLLIGMTSVHNQLFESKSLTNWTVGSEKTESDLYNSVCSSNDSTVCRIAYYPKSKFSDKIMENLKEILSNSNSERKFEFLPVNDSSQIVTYAIIHRLGEITNNYLGGVVFHHGGSTNISNPPKQFQFTIRQAHYFPIRRQSLILFDYDANRPKLYRAFVGLELALTRSYMKLVDESIKLKAKIVNDEKRAADIRRNDTNGNNTTIANTTTNSSTLPKRQSKLEINLKEFPLPPHFEHKRIDGNKPNIELVLAHSIVLGTTFIVFTLVKGAVSDKETGFKLYVKLMGLPRWAFWLSWIINEFIIQFIAVSLLVILLFNKFNTDFGQLVIQGDASLWFVFLLLYALSSITFLTFIASFFKRGIMATYVSATIWLLTYYFMDLYLPSFILTLSHITNVGTCLLPTGAIILAVNLMTALAEGAQWENLQSPLEENGVTLAEIMAMLLTSVILQFILTLYVDNMRPGIHEALQPWYSFLSIRIGGADKFEKALPAEIKKPEMSASLHDTTVLNGEQTSKYDIEKQSGGVGKTIAVEFRNLGKKFGKNVRGVENISLNLYDCECSVFLGHHASGKTTTLRLLCGEYFPSHGTAFVYDNNIRTHQHQIQTFVGTCPQKNLLCEELTVHEHLMYVGQTKGLSRSQATEKIDHLLQSLELYDQSNRYPSELLEFGRRCLSIAMALVGNNKLILLDQPTGDIMEVDLKRRIWDYLIHIRSTTTMIVATTDIDEAYYLGQKIIILSQGHVIGSGPPDHLEDLFATGYHLHLNIDSDKGGENAKSNAAQFVKSVIPSSDLVEHKLRHFSRAVATLDSETFSPRLSMEDKSAEDKLAYLGIVNRFGRAIANTVNSMLDITKSRKTVISSNQSIKAGSEIEIPKRTGGDMEKEDLDEIGKVMSSTSIATRIQSYVAVKKHEDKSASDPQIIIHLPKYETSLFPKLFTRLENESEKWHITSYKLVPYNMPTAFEDVDQFMQLADILSSGFKGGLPSVKGIVTRNTYDSEAQSLLTANLDSKHNKRVGPCLKTFSRLGALIIKRFLWMWNNWLYISIQMGAPILLLIVTIQATNSYYEAELDGSNLTYAISHLFPRAHILYKVDNTSESINNTFKKYYVNELQSSSWSGIKIEEINVPFQEKLKLLRKTDSEIELLLFGKIGIGAEITSQEVTAMFSVTAFQAAPMSVAIILNATLKYMYPNLGYSIQPYSQPIKSSSHHLLKFYKTQHQESDPSISFAIMLGFGFFIFTSGFTIQPVAERTSLLKRLQLNTGLSSTIYWTSFLLCDFLLSVVLSGILAFGLWNFPAHDTFTHWEFIQFFIALWNLSAFSSILLSYLFSFYFHNAKTCYYGMLSINQVAGLFLFVLSETLDNSITQKIFRVVCRFIQPFNVPSGLYYLIKQATENSQCKLLSKNFIKALCKPNDFVDSKTWNNLDKSCCQCQNGPCKVGGSYLDWSNIPKNVLDTDDSGLVFDFIFLLCHTLFLIIYLRITQKGVSQKILRKTPHEIKLEADTIAKDNNTEAIQTDSSVGDEINSVELSLKKDPKERRHQLIIHGITRLYGKRCLVNHIYFIANPSSLTAIVGPSFSGKTALFEILASIGRTDCGNVYYNNSNLVSWNSSKFLKQVGYCPGKSITIEKMTGTQLLRLFGRLRGIPASQLDEHVKKWLVLLGLEDRANQLCQYYSEGMKRKLTLATALIGDPQILILDRPFTDLDPASVHQIWTILDHLCHAGNRIIIVFTTTNVEKIAYHCTKMAFIINGQLQCIMDPDKMMDKLGQGYTLTVILKVNPEDAVFETYAQLKIMISKEFQSSVLQEEQAYALIYRIPDTNYKWSVLFSKMELIREKFQLIIQDYSIQETIMEDLYHSFAMKQHLYKIPPSTWEQFCLTYC